MSRNARILRGRLIVLHRWLGLPFCLLFCTWFLSGFVLMYCPFPAVDEDSRLARAAPLDPGGIHLTPAQAFAALQASTAPSDLRLNLLDGRPVYRFSFHMRARLVFADDGQVLDAIPRSMALRIASAWTGSPAPHALWSEQVNDDQWTLDPSVQQYRPFWKFAWPSGEEVYVSRVTGEVAQATTRSSRLGAWFGAIPHWLYFAPLRRHAGLWSHIVIWLSGIGALTAALGLTIGLWLYSPTKRYHFQDGPSRLPYRGPKRWHLALGLVFGLFTCTWVFSGMLSMGPFSWLSGPDTPDLDRSLRGDRLDLANYSKDPRQVLSQAGRQVSVKELDFTGIGNQAMYLALETPRKSRIVPVNGPPRELLDTQTILSAVTRAASPRAIAGSRRVSDYESYYLDRERRLPLPVLYVQLNGSGHPAYYIDLKTGKVVQSYGRRSRWNRWLYHGLHSLDFPWLYARRPAWDFLVLVLLLGGTLLAATSLWIASRVVVRKFRQ